METAGKPGRPGTAVESHPDGSCAGCDALNITLRPITGRFVRTS